MEWNSLSAPRAGRGVPHTGTGSTGKAILSGYFRWSLRFLRWASGSRAGAGRGRGGGGSSSLSLSAFS